MSLSIILYIFLGIAAIFMLYNIVVIAMLWKYHFVGRLVGIVFPIYLVALVLVCFITWGYLGGINWDQTLHLSTFKFW